MKYNLTIAPLDKQAAADKKVGLESRMKYSLVLFRAVGALAMSAVGVGTYVPNGAFSAPSTGGNDVQAILQTANPGLTAPLTAVWNATLSDGSSGFASAVFTVPSYAPDQGFHMPQGLGVDLVASTVAATATLTGDGTNVADGTTVQIGGITYTFKSALTGAAYQVLIGASEDASITNLINAINYTGTPGTDYVDNGGPNPQVTAGTVITAHAVTLTAIVPGTAGNSLVSVVTGSHLSFGTATFANGADAAGKNFRSIGTLVAMAGGSPGVELDLFVLPAATDWHLIDYPIMKNINPGNVTSVAIPNRYKAAGTVKKGRGGMPSVSLSSNQSTFAMDLARLAGQEVAIMVEDWDNDRVLSMRTLAQTVLNTDGGKRGGGNEEVITTAEGMASQFGVFC